MRPPALPREGDGTVEIAAGAKVWHPMDRNTAGEWVPRLDEVAIADCPVGTRRAPPQPRFN